MGVRKPRTKAGSTMTEQGYIGWIRSWLRRAWLKYPVRFQVMKAASRKVTGKRHKTEYQCAECTKWYKGSEIEVDHIHGCGSFTKLEDLPSYTSKLFCEPEDARVLCKPCHQTHTRLQREARQEKTNE